MRTGQTPPTRIENGFQQEHERSVAIALSVTTIDSATTHTTSRINLDADRNSLAIPLQAGSLISRGVRDYRGHRRLGAAAPARSPHPHRHRFSKNRAGRSSLVFCCCAPRYGFESLRLEQSRHGALSTEKKTPCSTSHEDRSFRASCSGYATRRGATSLDTSTPTLPRVNGNVRLERFRIVPPTHNLPEPYPAIGFILETTRRSLVQQACNGITCAAVPPRRATAEILTK